MDETIDALIELASIEHVARNKHLPVEGGIRAMEERRVELRQALPAFVLAAYDALVHAGRHPAIVATSGAYCGGCNLRLPEKLAGHVRGEKNLFTCPQCRRFLYFNSWSAPERRVNARAAERRAGDEGEDKP